MIEQIRKYYISFKTYVPYVQHSTLARQSQGKNEGKPGNTVKNPWISDCTTINDLVFAGKERGILHT